MSNFQSLQVVDRVPLQKFSQSQIPSSQVNTPKSQEGRANKQVSNLNCITPPTFKNHSHPNSNLNDILCWNILGISTKLQDTVLCKLIGTPVNYDVILNIFN